MHQSQEPGAGNIYTRVNKLETDMYFGDGRENPSMTTRMTLVEDIIKKLTWIASITLAAVIGEVVMRLMKIL
jgi:hypothetical protein